MIVTVCKGCTIFAIDNTLFDALVYGLSRSYVHQVGIPEAAFCTLQPGKWTKPKLSVSGSDSSTNLFAASFAASSLVVVVALDEFMGIGSFILVETSSAIIVSFLPPPEVPCDLPSIFILTQYSCASKRSVSGLRMVPVLLKFPISLVEQVGCAQPVTGGGSGV